MDGDFSPNTDFLGFPKESLWEKPISQLAPNPPIIRGIDSQSTLVVS